MAVTQKQIATELGMSQSMVSYAFNDDPRIPPATRQRVLDVAERLGYDFAGSREARTLIARRYGRKVRSGLIATILPSHQFHGTPAIQIPFYQELLSGIEAEAETHGSAMLLCSTYRPNLGSFLRSHNVDGVISVDDDPNLREVLGTLDAPCCIVGRGSNDISNVTFDSQRGIELTTQHLIDLGHRRIGFIGLAEDHFEGHVRAKAYRKTLKKNGLVADSHWCQSGHEGFEQCIPGAIDLVRRSPELTALVCVNDLVASNAVRLLHELGIKVPQDLSVVGFDNVRNIFGDSLTITSVSYDRFGMGRRAVQRLYEDFENKAQSLRESFPVSLAIHASTAPPHSQPLLKLT